MAGVAGLLEVRARVLLLSELLKLLDSLAFSGAVARLLLCPLRVSGWFLFWHGYGWMISVIRYTQMPNFQSSGFTSATSQPVGVVVGLVAAMLLAQITSSTSTGTL